MYATIQSLDNIDIATIRSRLGDQGWAALPLLDPDAVAATRNRLSAIAADCRADGTHPVLGRVVQFEEGFDPAGDAERRELGVRKWMNFQHDPFFASQVRQRRIDAILSALLGPGCQLLQAMALSKPPGIGSPKDWHQDTPYFPLDRIDRCLGFWIALDDADLENGCMQFVPGSHRGGQLPHEQGPTGWRLPVKTATTCMATAVPVPVAAGTAIVFDARCIHFTAANRSPRRRRALQYHYVSADTAPATPGACTLEAL